MKGWRVVTLLFLCLVLISSISCNPFGGEKEVSEEPVKVVRGDLMVTVSGSGNIEVAKEIKLTFGVAGKIDRIYVEENDEVKKGDVLAKLETTDLELALAQAHLAVTQAQVAQTQARLTVTQAETALKTAEYNLEQAQTQYILSDIKAAEADITVAKRDLEDILWTLSKYEPGTSGWEEFQKRVIQAQTRLKTAEDKLKAMLSGTDTAEVAIKRLQVVSAQQSLELAQQSVATAQQSLEVAQQSLALSQKRLREATITAPFDGVVAKVSADEKDTVSTTTQIIHLIDPSSMELKIEVDEIDVTGVRAGQRAILELDALVGLPFEGRVSSVSQLSKEEGGVITYDVTIKFDVPKDAGVRIGMSATADIVIAERTDALLVPSRAIKQDSRGNTLVEVKVNGQVEERVIVAGISDGFQTEIIEGLKEGEMVIRK